MARKRNRVAVALAAAALAGGGAGVGALAVSHDGSHSSSGPKAAAAPTPTAAAPTTTAQTATSVASATLSVGQVAKDATPAVVEIDSTEASSGSPFPGSGGTSSAEGSGFVYDSKGDIVTNDHVIAGASSISVKFQDGSTYKATVVGADPSTDIAVIHTDAPTSKLTVLTLGDSSAVAVGDGVVAIGNPFGLDDTVTSGIVSAIDREITAPDNTPIEGAIQTDAAINHGNSGGPLLDLQGKVIGITSQIQSESGGNEGVGFAVPSNTVRQIAGELISTGKAEHALMGVEVEAVTGGAKVTQVESGTGASSAGIQVGDVITAVDGTTVTSPSILRLVIGEHQPGDKVQVTLTRAGSSKTVSVTLGNRTS